MNARDNENQKLHICTLHILSQPGVCAWAWDSSVLQLNATNYITISPWHLRSHDLLSSDPNFLNWTNRTGNLLRNYSLCATWKSEAITYHKVCKRFTLKCSQSTVQDVVQSALCYLNERQWGNCFHWEILTVLFLRHFLALNEMI